MDEYISINKIAELKGLKSTRSIRLAINQGKYIAREVEVRGGKSYEILYSSLEPDIQDRLDEEELKTTSIVPFENKVNFVSENARLTALARVDIVTAEKVISIVPADSPLIIKTSVLDKDIGFVKEEMPVQVKIDTFDFQKYGMIEGKVKKVSKDSVEDEKQVLVYDVFITPVTKSLIVDGKEQQISTGMGLSAEIKTGKRRIIEFFIYPIIKYWSEAVSIK